MSEDILSDPISSAADSDHVVYMISADGTEKRQFVTGEERAVFWADLWQADNPKAYVIWFLLVRMTEVYQPECRCGDTGLLHYDEHARQLPKPVICPNCRPHLLNVATVIPDFQTVVAEHFGRAA